MSAELVGDVVRLAAAVLVVTVLVVLLLGTRGAGPLGGIAARRAVAPHRGVVDLAVSRGWWVGRGEDAARRAFDPRIAADRVEPVHCDLLVDGGADDGFVAESWSVRVRNLGAPLGVAARQHVLRVPCRSGRHFLIRGVPSRHELRYFPREFREQAGFARFHTQMLVAGDVAAVQDRLGPLVDAIQRSRLWVVGLEDEVVLMSGNEPDADELERRLALARAVVDALGSVRP